MKYFLFILILSCTAVQGEDIRTLYIADKLADCTGVGKQKCMLVKSSPDEEWTYFYDQIAGFDYEEGYNYELSVKVVDVENPPADASSQNYTLIELVSKTPAKNVLQDGADLIGSWKVIQIDGVESIKSHPTFEFSEEENRVSGSAGCNNYFASYEVKGKELTLGNAGSTRMMCQDMTVEDAFLKNLSEIAYYKVIKSELHLFDARDKMIMLAIKE